MCTLVLHSRRRARQAFFRFDGRSCEGAFTHYRYSHRQPTPVAPIHALRPPCRRRALGRGGRAAALLPGKRPGGSTVATKICSRRNLLELDVQHDEVELAVEQLGVVVVARLLEDHIELRELAHLAECGCEQTGTQARAPARAKSEALIACTGQARGGPAAPFGAGQSARGRDKSEDRFACGHLDRARGSGLRASEAPLRLRLGRFNGALGFQVTQSFLFPPLQE